VTTVHAVLPDGIDDPARPSGGNVYDRHVCDGLAALGWSVHEHAVGGFWNRPDAAAFGALADAVGEIPDGDLVLVDGLIASAAPDVLVPEAGRLRLAVLVHMPFGDRPRDGDARTGEGAVLMAASKVVTTSAWARERLLELYALPGGRVHVAHPGVDPAELAAHSASGGSLLCVAAVSFDKGHDLLLDALATISDLNWSCVCVGRLDRDPTFVETMRRHSLDARVQFPGPRSGAELDRSYAAADVMVLASRAETYGMVVIEALARGVPVIAADVGGLTEALGHGADGIRPGSLIPADDAAALAEALRSWLGDGQLRARLRRAALQRRESLPSWSSTASVLAAVLTEASQ